MNGKEYQGTFHWTLSFNEVCLILAIPSALMVRTPPTHHTHHDDDRIYPRNVTWQVPISWLCIKEEAEPRTEFVGYMKATWEMMRSRAFFFVFLFQFLDPVIQYVQSTASGYVQQSWAGVETLQNQMFNILSYLVFM